MEDYYANHKEHKIKRVQKVKIFRSSDAEAFEKSVNEFLANHDVVDITYKTEYVPDFRDFFNICFIVYMGVVDYY